MDGWIDVSERPLVRRKLSVRMHVPLSAQEKQLGLCEIWIDSRQRDAVKREVPGRVPRILPLVGHRDHIAVVEMQPGRVATRQALRRWFGAGGIALQPTLDVVVVELLRPEHASHRLPEDIRLRRRSSGRRHLCIERAGFAAALVHDGVKVAADAHSGCAQPEPDRRLCTGADPQVVAKRRLGAQKLRIDGCRSGHDVVVDAVLREAAAAGDSPQTLGVCLVVAEEGPGRAVGCQSHSAQFPVLSDDVGLFSPD